MNKSLFALMAMLTLISACQKSGDDGGNNNPDKTQLITSASWKFSNAGLDNNNDGTKDADLPPGILATCDTDNIITFKSDKTGIMDEGATKCQTTDPQSVNFNWDITNNGNNINVSAALFPGLDGDAKILELSSTKLTISKSITYMNITFTAIVFFVH